MFGALPLPGSVLEQPVRLLDTIAELVEYFKVWRKYKSYGPKNRKDIPIAISARYHLVNVWSSEV